MDSDQGSLHALKVALENDDRLAGIEMNLVAVDRQRAEILGGKLRLDDPFHQRLGTAAIADQLFDADDRGSALPGNLEEAFSPSHLPILIENFNQGSNRSQPGQPGEVDSRLSMPRAVQDAALVRDQRIDMPRTGELPWGGLLGCEGPDRITTF